MVMAGALGSKFLVLSQFSLFTNYGTLKISCPIKISYLCL